MRTNEPERPPFALLAAVTAVAISGSALVPPTLPDLAEGLAVAPSVGGLALAAAMVPGIALTPLIGAWSDRHGRRATLMACLVTFGAGAVVAALAATFPVLVGARLVQGVGAAGLIGLVIAIIGDGWTGTERVRMLGRNAAVLTISVIASPLLGGALGAVGGWRLPMLVQGVALVIAVAMRRRLRGEDRVTLHGPGPSAVIRTVVRDRALAAAVACGAIAYLLLFGLVLTVVPAQLAQAGHGPVERGLLLAVPGVPAALVSLRLGPITDRFGAARLIRCAFAMWAVGFVAIAVHPSVTAIAFALVAYGLGEGLLLPTLQERVMQRAPAEARGGVVACHVAATRLGATAGPLLAVPFLAGGSSGAAFAVGAAVAVLLAVAASRTQAGRIGSSSAAACGP